MRLYRLTGIIALGAAAIVTVNAEKVHYRELPEAVRNTLGSRNLTSPINDIDKMVKDGKTTYEVGFKENGAQTELLISEDGRILSDTSLSNAGAAAGTSTGQGIAATQKSPTKVELSGSQKIEMEQAPQPVRTAIVKHSGGARVEDLERGSWNGQPVYQAAFKSGNKHVELQVAEDGTIVHDPRIQATGRAPARATGTATAQQSNTLVNLSSAQKVDRRSVPAAVEKALRTHTEGARIEDLEQGGWNGKTVYQAAFKDDGKHVELQIDENGNLIHDTRTSQK